MNVFFLLNVNDHVGCPNCINNLSLERCLYFEHIVQSHPLFTNKTKCIDLIAYRTAIYNVVV